MASHLNFGNAIIPMHQTFLVRKNVFAFPSYKPIDEGHALVSTKRISKKIAELT